jgi:hypothetical protein
MMVRGHKHSIQNGLNKVFEELGALADVPTAGAFSKARKKVKAEVFIELNRGLCQDFYTVYGAEKEVVKWHGQRLLGFDGTVLNLPDTSELRASYSVQSNQHGECVQGLCGVLYDVHNDLGLAAAMGPRTNEARVLMSDSVWQATQKGDVIIMDRNFVHYGLIAFAGKDKRGVIIRCPKCGFTEILDFWESDDIDRLVTLHKPNTSDVRELCEKYDLPSSVQVRLIKVTLSTVDCRPVTLKFCSPTCVMPPPILTLNFNKSTAGAGMRKRTSTASSISSRLSASAANRNASLNRLSLGSSF